MKTENLLKAHQTAQFLLSDIQEAHADAAESDNQFAEIAISEALEISANLERKIKTLLHAANT